MSTFQKNSKLCEVQHVLSELILKEVKVCFKKTNKLICRKSKRILNAKCFINKSDIIKAIIKNYLGLQSTLICNENERLSAAKLLALFILIRS